MKPMVKVGQLEISLESVVTLKLDPLGIFFFVLPSILIKLVFIEMEKV